MDNIITKPSPASPQELSSLLTESRNNEKNNIQVTGLYTWPQKHIHSNERRVK